MCANQIELSVVIDYLLMQHFFDANILDEDFCSPLHYAVNGNNKDGAAILINNGEFQARRFKSAVNAAKSLR